MFWVLIQWLKNSSIYSAFFTQSRCLKINLHKRCCIPVQTMNLRGKLTIRILSATALTAASMFSVSSSAVMAEWPTRAMLQQEPTVESGCWGRCDHEAGVTHRKSCIKVVETGSTREEVRLDTQWFSFAPYLARIQHHNRIDRVADRCYYDIFAQWVDFS